MKKVLFLVLFALFVMTSVDAYSQEAEAAKKASSSNKISLENLEGLTEEQILALLKGLELEEILSCLKMTVGKGSRELLVNMIGAVNKYISTIEPSAALNLAQKATSENTELSFGTNKTGKPQIFVVVVNNTMNSVINTTTEAQQEIVEEKTVISGAGSL